jgi:type I restriction enzyme R subunit
MSDYATISSIYEVIRKAYSQRVYVDKAFQRKTDELVQKYIDTTAIATVTDFVEINAQTLEVIQAKQGGETIKVINLIKSIEKSAEENSDDPFLIAMAERAKTVQDNFENRQINTQEALETLLAEINQNEQRKKEQAERGFDSLSFFVYQTLEEAGINNPESVSSQIKQAFIEHPHWQTSEAELRELRKEATFAVFAESDDLDQVTAIVDKLFTLLSQTYAK